MSTFVIALKNTTADNAFACLRAMNGKVVNGEMVFVGPCQRYMMSTNRIFTKAEGMTYIAKMFADTMPIHYPANDLCQPGGAVLCIRISKTEFVFFGRYT